MLNYLLHSCGSEKLFLKKESVLIFSMILRHNQVQRSFLAFMGTIKEKKQNPIEKVYSTSPAVLCLLRWVFRAPERSLSEAFRF